MPDDKLRNVFQAGRVEDDRPIQSGRFCGELFALPHPCGTHVLRFQTRGVDTGHFCFESEDSGGAHGRIGHAGEHQHRGDVHPILRAQFLHLWRFGNVVIAVGHSEAALQEIRNGARRVHQVQRDPDAEQIFGIKVRRIERVDIRTKTAANYARKSVAILDTGDGIQLRLQRRDAFRLDRCLVHVTGIEIGDLLYVLYAGSGPGTGSRPRSFLKQCL